MYVYSRVKRLRQSDETIWETAGDDHGGCEGRGNGSSSRRLRDPRSKPRAHRRRGLETPRRRFAQRAVVQQSREDEHSYSSDSRRHFKHVPETLGMSLGLVKSVARRLSAPKFLLAAGGILFLTGLILPYLFSPGLPLTYDLTTHYHMGYRILRGLWDPTWSAGVTTIDYPPGALLLASEFASALTFLADPYLSFKIFYYLLFFASIGAVYFLSKTFDPSSTLAATSLFLAA